MKLKLPKIITAISLCLGLIVGQAVGDSLPKPGSSQDPLVTKSYVDALIKKEFTPLFTSTGTLEEKVEEIKKTVQVLNKYVAPLSLKIIMQLNNKSADIGEKTVMLDTAPFVENGRTLVPFRFVGEALGAEVGWIKEEKKVVYNLSDKNISMIIGSKNMQINDKTIIMDVPAKIVNGRTVVPIRIISEQLGAEVKWLSQTKEIIIEAGNT